MNNLKNKILSYPKCYSFLQDFLYRDKYTSNPISNIAFKGNEIVLDIGCGPAQILQELPKNIKYYGYDLSETYIDFAKNYYKNRNAIFKNEVISKMNIPQELINNTDIVISTGVLHHISDEDVKNLFSVVNMVLKKGGKFYTQDPYFRKNQHPIAKFLINNDRGNFVRYENEYRELAEKYLGSDIEIICKDDTLIFPYDNLYMVYTKP